MNKSFIVNYIWRVVQFASKSLTPLFINFYAAKVLLPEEFGKIVYILTIFGIINLISNFGFSAAVLKEAALYKSQDEDSSIKNIFPSVAGLNLLVSLILLIIVYILYPDISVIILWSIPYVLFNPLVAILDGIFVGVQEFKRMSIVTFFIGIITVLFSYFLINEFQQLGVVISYSCLYFLLFLVYYFVFSYKGGGFSSNVFFSVAKYAIVVGLGSVAFFLYTRVDIIVLKSFGYITEIGSYELIMKFFEITNIPIILLGQVAASYFIGINVQGSKDKLYKYIRFSSLSVFLLGIVIAVVLYFVIPVLIKIYYPAYNTQDFYNILLILLLTIPLKYVGIFMTNAIIVPLGYAKIVSYSTLAFGIVNVGLDYLFIYKFGFIGIFYATLIVHNINIVFQYILFWRKVK
ncbi:lipopolysaccharide biosynthesis protein [Saccharicrinis sp. GN24d3]|uniref:lipopolysaccharide biosynthesis protein n=1 Tax=Saccharicrinis sp. GN24d3 TaxID=3458416 RepID=UPI0040357DCF